MPHLLGLREVGPFGLSSELCSKASIQDVIVWAIGAHGPHNNISEGHINGEQYIHVLEPQAIYSRPVTHLLHYERYF